MPIMQVNASLYYKKCSEYSDKCLYIWTNAKIFLNKFGYFVCFSIVALVYQILYHEEKNYQWVSINSMNFF